jgi:hypothetical protein
MLNKNRVSELDRFHKVCGAIFQNLNREKRRSFQRAVTSFVLSKTWRRFPYLAKRRHDAVRHRDRHLSIVVVNFTTFPSR